MSDRTRYGMDRSAMNPNAIKLKPIDPPEPRKATGFIPYGAPLAILDNTHYLPKSKSDAMLKRYLNHDIGEVLTISPDNTPESFPIPQPLICLDESTPFTEEHAKALDSLIKSRRIKARYD